MSDKTGYAPGRVNPIVYFVNKDGDLLLPPTTEDARWLYRTHYQHRGWEWQEASTLVEVDALQARLVSRERDKLQREVQRDERLLMRRREEIRSSLYQRMISAATSEYEREFLRLYLQLREEKREKWRQRWLERTSYLWAREQDSHTSATERMLGEPGDQWRNSAQAKT